MTEEAKELLEIVDENGNPTGKYLEREEVHNQNLFHNEVGCFIINDKKEILLEKRSLKKRYSPGKYGLCAGHVIKGETLIEGLIREIKEELGIDVSEKDLIPFGKRETVIKETNSHFTYFYYLKLNLPETAFVIQEEELSEVKWFPIDTVIKKVLAHDETTVFYENRLYLLEYLKNVK